MNKKVRTHPESYGKKKKRGKTLEKEGHKKRRRSKKSKKEKSVARVVGTKRQHLSTSKRLRRPLHSRKKEKKMISNKEFVGHNL